MTYTEKINFIHKYLSHELNADEIKEFEAWIEYDIENKLLFDQISGIWNSSAPSEEINFNAENAFLKHKARLNEEKHESVVPSESYIGTRVIFMRPLRIAAAILVLLIAAVFVMNVSNGDKINAEAVQLVLLEDGSKVWLDEGSQFVIKKINKSERKVTLKGKAYFEVAKNSAAPFYISSGNFDVKVVGTRFIIDSKQSIVKVRDGKVAVVTDKQEVLLTANQSVEIKNNVLSEIDNTTFDNKLLWFNEELKFDNTPFDLVIKDLMINFGVQIDLPENKDWSNCPFTSGSLKNNTFDEVLTILKLTYEIEYKKTGEASYKITRVKCK
jgi:ferric-dicitrate binding protein FerR (iron transport regulator)